MTCPTGTVTLTGNSLPVDNGTYTLNSAGYTRDLVPNLTGGTYTLAAQYSGDHSYNSSLATESFTVAPAPTALSEQALVAFPVANQPFPMQVLGSTQAPHGISPTGTVTFFEGPTQLAAPVNVNGIGSGSSPLFFGNTNLTISSAGPHTITARYSGDANYAASSTFATVSVLNPTTPSVSISPTTITYGSSVTITAIIDTAVPVSNAALKPTGNLSLFANYDGQIANPAITQTADVNGNWEIQVTATITPQSSEFITVSYGGDTNYAGSSSNSFLTVNIPDFNVMVSGPLLATVGQSGSVQMSVVPASNTASPVTLSCYDGLPIGYQCSFQPNPLNLANGAAATVTLTLSPAPVAQAISRVALARKHAIFWPFETSGPSGSSPYWALAAATCLLACHLLFWPWRRNGFRPALVCGLACMISLLGCGGGGGTGVSTTGSGGTGGTPAPSATTTTLSISAPTVPTGNLVTLTAKVTGQGSPTGMVTFQMGGFWFGQANLVGDTATVTSNAPFPGLYQVIANYNGDASHAVSASAPVQEGVTGSTSALVIAQTGSLSHTAFVTMTLQ